MFGKQKHEVSVLYAKACADVRREQATRQRLQRQTQQFFINPVNLLLPFTVGMLTAGLIQGRGKKRSASSPGPLTLINTAIGLWSATAVWRERLFGTQSAHYEPPASQPPRPRQPPRKQAVPRQSAAYES